jgi:hypothetical protein
VLPVAALGLCWAVAEVLTVAAVVVAAVLAAEESFAAAAAAPGAAAPQDGVLKLHMAVVRQQLVV